MSCQEAVPLVLPRRTGVRPLTCRRIPHTQLDQQPDARVRARLARRIADFPGADKRASAVSVPGARALCLPASAAAGPREAFLIDREFAHLHPVPDSSLHLSLPPHVAEAAISAGWGEFHPLAGTDMAPPTIVMVYAPRDDAELEIVLGLVGRAFAFAADAERGEH
jgi:hypothetical protein